MPGLIGAAALSWAMIVTHGQHRKELYVHEANLTERLQPRVQSRASSTPRKEGAPIGADLEPSEDTRAVFGNNDFGARDRRRLIFPRRGEI